jgi:hypothetical protein
METFDNLHKRNARYPGDYKALADKYDKLLANDKPQWFDNGQCARLPQLLTDVGYTGRWQPGPRVVDLSYLLPGTVIANFSTVNGNSIFPNQHGWHAGLFDRFWRGAKLANGLPCEFSMFDQWKGPKSSKGAGRRGVAILTPEFIRAHPDFNTPSNRADDFYVVVVP